MPLITLTTIINAPVETCFKLSRSIDLHLKSMLHTNEEAIDGVKAGLIGFNETVTWRAWHFGLPLQMTIKITELMYATSFTDEQLAGPFSKLKHRHIFEYLNESQTLMMDEFEFEAPLGIIGRLVNDLYLKAYMTRLLIKRNQTIKQAAESIDY
jgi:ligand-binding SRPBCC domain-containing protein